MLQVASSMTAFGWSWSCAWQRLAPDTTAHSLLECGAAESEDAVPRNSSSAIFWRQLAALLMVSAVRRPWSKSLLSGTGTWPRVTFEQSSQTKRHFCCTTFRRWSLGVPVSRCNKLTSTNDTAAAISCSVCASEEHRRKTTLNW